jgi:hypothetical protein
MTLLSRLRAIRDRIIAAKLIAHATWLPCLSCGVPLLYANLACTRLAAPVCGPCTEQLATPITTENAQ